MQTQKTQDSLFDEYLESPAVVADAIVEGIKESYPNARTVALKIFGRNWSYMVVDGGEKTEIDSGRRYQPEDLAALVSNQDSGKLLVNCEPADHTFEISGDLHIYTRDSKVAEVALKIADRVDDEMYLYHH